MRQFIYSDDLARIMLGMLASIAAQVNGNSKEEACPSVDGASPPVHSVPAQANRGPLPCPGYEARL